jgi:N-acetylglucosaminyldiphosphoundecaprenol N-acetyl-beta-D-mannosaminyltransferase
MMTRRNRANAARSDSFSILGVRIHAVQIPDVIAQMQEWIARRGTCRYIAVTGMHGIMEARHDSAFKEILNSSSLTVPDGMPLVWLARWNGHPLKRRVYGPDLMLSFCEHTSGKGVRHFFYGGAPGVAEKLAEELANRFPGIVVAGTYAPPFRALTCDEQQEVVSRLAQAAPDVLWVGLSTPKQERWMREYSSLLNVPVLVGVGAAFDIHSREKKQAPGWMREHGLEWFFRLLQEPRRLSRRYVLYGTEFVFWIILETLGLHRFK